MTVKDEKRISNSPGEMKWHSMFGLSILFHLGIFSFFLFVPEAMPNRHYDSIIYSVDLVEMPARDTLELRQAKSPSEKTTEVKKDEDAKRISKPKEEKKPLVIAKRTIQTKKPSAKKPEISPA